MLAACGGNAPASNSNGGDGSGNTPAKVAKLSYGLSSPAEFSYHNMRPQYNYYLTTFSFQTLDLFDDGTYQLNDILMTFSAVVLPEEGQDGQGNERDNVVSRFYGKYTSAPDDLDDTILNISLDTPDRLVVFSDSSAFYDTANWTPEMAKLAGTTTQYNTDGSTSVVEGEESAIDFLKDHAFSPVVVSSVPSQGKADYAKLSVPEGGNQNAKLGTYKDGLKNGFSSPSSFAYHNMRPQYNYYLTTFSMQTLETYEDGKYIFNEYSSCFSAVVLPEEGQNGQGNERDNSHYSFYGTFTSQPDDLDDSIVNYSLSESTRIVGRVDASVFYDTENWTPEMSKKAGSTTQYNTDGSTSVVEGEKTAAEYLAENKKPASVATTIPSKGSMDIVSFRKA